MLLVFVSTFSTLYLSGPEAIEIINTSTFLCSLIPGILGSGFFNNISLGGAVRDEEDKNGPCLLELIFSLPINGTIAMYVMILNIITLCLGV